MDNEVEFFKRLPEIKEIWQSQEVQAELKVFSKKMVFLKHIFPRFFQQGGVEPQTAFWWFCRTLLKQIKKEEHKKVDREFLKELTEEAVNIMQVENRKRTVYLLNQLLIKYHETGYENVSLTEITRLYDRIQAAEEATKRTELAKRKEARESVTTYFNLLSQYGKLDEAEIDNLIQILKDARTTRQIQTSNS